jgi:hypothetical protein
VALRLDRALPRAVFGPVESRAFLRFASSLRVLTVMTESLAIRALGGMPKDDVLVDIIVRLPFRYP